MIFNKFSPQALRDAIEFELQKTEDPKIASIIAIKKMNKNPEYYIEEMNKAINNNEEAPKNGTIKPSTREGKKAMVFMDGKWHHFGDDSLGHNYSNKARKAAKSRHKKNLEGNDSRAKAFRIYWKHYWEKGGKVKTPMKKAFIKIHDNIYKYLQKAKRINNKIYFKVK